MEQTIQTIEQAISTERMLSVIASLSRHHRLQASAGYRDAAKECLAILQDWGIPARIVSYPAVYGRRYMSQNSFCEWNCTNAWCRMISPDEKTLANFAEDPISIFQKSVPCDYRDKPIDVVLLDKGNQPDAYKDISLEGKLIFVRDDFNAYLDWAIREGGALGFLSDYVVEAEGARSREEMRHVRKYTTFWWTKEESIHPFGFVISPEEGDRLAAQCRQIAAAHETDPSKPAYPQVTCFVDAVFQDGTFENVEAFLPGETEEEVWLIAHLCHPKPSANDNLSGVSAAMEAMRIVQETEKKDPSNPLKRGVRLLLVPEYTGTFAYLETVPNVRHVKAAINLDMVGGKQELGYGPLTLSGVPDALPSFSDELASIILQALRRDVAGFSPEYRLPLFNSAECGFVTGSDNFILSDPAIGIPTPMLSQWPDKFYHTNGDTSDVISPFLLKKAAACAASYIWLMANLSPDDARLVAGELLAHLQRRLSSVAARTDMTPAQRLRALSFYGETCSLSAEKLLNYFEGEEKAICERRIGHLRSAIQRIAEANRPFMAGGADEIGIGIHGDREHRGNMPDARSDGDGEISVGIHEDRKRREDMPNARSEGDGEIGSGIHEDEKHRGNMPDARSDGDGEISVGIHEDGKRREDMPNARSDGDGEIGSGIHEDGKRCGDMPNAHSDGDGEIGFGIREDGKRRGDMPNARDCDDGADALIPVRLFRGPVIALDDYADTAEKRTALRRYSDDHRPKLKDSALAELTAQYCTDGRHTVSEIAERVLYASAGNDAGAMEAYIRLLVTLGLCAWREDVSS
jgi:hypothetical protein